MVAEGSVARFAAGKKPVEAICGGQPVTALLLPPQDDRELRRTSEPQQLIADAGDSLEEAMTAHAPREPSQHPVGLAVSGLVHTRGGPSVRLRH